MEQYKDFLERKLKTKNHSGFEIPLSSINSLLFDFQKAIVQKSLKRGKYAVFADCGTGKSPIQLEIAHHVAAYTNKPFLILADVNF